jgi:hypothetical protein
VQLTHVSYEQGAPFAHLHWSSGPKAPAFERGLTTQIWPLRAMFATNVGTAVGDVRAHVYILLC